MLDMLRQIAQDAMINFESVYLGHIQRDEDRKILTFADALPWNDMDGNLRGILMQHLYQMLDGDIGKVNFPSHYTGEVLSVSRVAGDEYDRLHNRPTVEVLEAIRDLPAFDPRAMIELGNVLAYKVMSAGAIRNHMVAIVRFQVAPQLGDAPVTYVMATILDLDDREETLFEPRSNRWSTQQLANVLKHTKVARAALFPCRNEQGRETADLMVYAGSGSAAWFKALEVAVQLSPEREGKALLRMIAEQAEVTEVPHTLLAQMGETLQEQAETGLTMDMVAQSLERGLGRGIDRLGLRARWESTFGDLTYRPQYHALFASQDAEPELTLKMEAGPVTITCPPQQLAGFRQIRTGGATYIVFRVPESARIVTGKDLDIRIRPVDMADLSAWLQEEPV